MKLTIGWDGKDEMLRFARQVGATHLKLNAGDYMDEKRRGPLRRDVLLRDRDRIRAHDLQIGVVLLPLEPGSQFWDIRLGGPRREQEIEDVRESIRVLGGEGVSVVEYAFNMAGVFGSRFLPRGRGGAIVRHFDYQEAIAAPPEPSFCATEEQLWQRLAWFLERVVPVAEQAGVRLACHPDDPPVPTLKGETRVLRNWEGMVRLIEMVPSPANGINLCQGTVAEMGVDVIEAIRYFGSRGKIHHVHFRNVKGTVPTFDESFIDDGDVDMHQAMRAYREVGYAGTIMEDHWPEMEGGSALVGRAFALGYMKALMAELGVLES